MKERSLRTLRAWTVLLAVGLSSTGMPAAAKPSPVPPPAALKLPYREGEVYRVKLVPGTPFVVEMPSGETVDYVARDAEYWGAEWYQGATRVVIRAIDATDIGKRKSFVHIFTESGLRISLRVQVVGAEADVPGSLKIYLEAGTASDSVKQQVQKRVDGELLLAKRAAEQEVRAKFEAWKKATLSNFRADYDKGGDFVITRVVDNGLQTFITVPDGSDKGIIQFVNKEGKANIINAEFSNGVYTTENKVLQRGEQFRIILGKERAWVRLK